MFRRIVSRLIFAYHVALCHGLILSLIALHRDAFLFCLGMFLLSGVFLGGSLVRAINWMCDLYEGIYRILGGAIALFTTIAVAILLILGSLHQEPETQNRAGRLALVGFYSIFILAMPAALASIIREGLRDHRLPVVPTREPKVMPTRPAFNALDMAELEKGLRASR